MLTPYESCCFFQSLLLVFGVKFMEKNSNWRSRQFINRCQPGFSGGFRPLWEGSTPPINNLGLISMETPFLV